MMAGMISSDGEEVTLFDRQNVSTQSQDEMDFSNSPKINQTSRSHHKQNGNISAKASNHEDLEGLQDQGQMALDDGELFSDEESSLFSREHGNAEYQSDKETVISPTNGKYTGNYMKEEHNEVVSRKKRCLNVVTTVSLVCMWVCLGYSSGIFAPTIIDLKTMVHANYEEISRVQVALSIGIMVGALIGGVIGDKFPEQLEYFVCIETFVMGVAGGTAPWWPNLEGVALSFFVTGLGIGALNTHGNTLCMYIWGEKAATPLHFIHMGFGIGTVIAPLSTVFFLSHDSPQWANQTLDKFYLYNQTNRNVPFMNTSQGFNWTMMNSENGDGFNLTEYRLSHIHIPYGIGGVLAILISVCYFMIFQINKSIMKRECISLKDKSFLELFNPKNCIGEQSCFGAFILICVFCYYVTEMGKDLPFINFMFPIAVESHLHFKKALATYVTTVFFVGYSSGRFVCAFLAHIIPVTILLFSEIIINTIIIIWMIAVDFGTPAEYWIMTFIFGFTSGPIYVGMLSWINHYFSEVSSLVITIVTLGTGIGGFIFSWLSGYIYQYVGQIEVMYLSVGNSAALIVIVIIAQVAASVNTRSERQKSNNYDAVPLLEASEFS